MGKRGHEAERELTARKRDFVARFQRALRSLVLPAIVFSVALALDQLSKLYMHHRWHAHWAIGRYVENPSSATLGASHLLVPLAWLSAMTALRSRLGRLAGALWLAGALGNLLWAGGVPDFILVPNIWPFSLRALGTTGLPQAGDLCNVADICLWVGSPLLILAVLCSGPRLLALVRRLRSQSRD